MALKKKRRLTKMGMVIISLFLCVVLFTTFFVVSRIVTENQLKKLDYSPLAIREIIRMRLVDRVKEIGKNESLDHAFMSDAFRLDYFDRYRQILYFDSKDFVPICNRFIESGYSDEEVNAIVRSGDATSIGTFSNRGYVKDVTHFLSFDYAKLENYDRYVSYQNENLTTDEETVVHVNIGLDLAFYENSDVISQFSVTVLANKYHQLGENYVPDQLRAIDSKYTLNSNQKLSSVAADAFERLAEDALKEDMTIKARSSYRSYQEQEALYQDYVMQYGKKRADELAARPGYSEHQSGLALDVGVSDTSVFASTKEFQWMKENAYKYGFVLRYPKNKIEITGYSYESWHYRYVGEEIAAAMKEKNLTYDEYYIMFLDR